MERTLKIFGILVVVISINSCAALRGAEIWRINAEIERSVLSVENEAFQQETEINLTIVKRGLWSMQSSFQKNIIYMYFRSLLNNTLAYSLDTNQKEFARQIIQNDEISISINDQYQNYSEFERAILLIASTSTLALLNDNNFNLNEAQSMFFRFIESYDPDSITGIVDAQWFRDRNVTVTGDGIIIGQ